LAGFSFPAWARAREKTRKTTASTVRAVTLDLLIVSPPEEWMIKKNEERFRNPTMRKGTAGGRKPIPWKLDLAIILVL
jgi:hypothetical protein